MTETESMKRPSTTVGRLFYAIGSHVFGYPRRHGTVRSSAKCSSVGRAREVKLLRGIGQAQHTQQIATLPRVPSHVNFVSLVFLDAGSCREK